MKSSKLILFESIQANFRLSIDNMYEKTKTDGTTQSTVFINQQKETGTFRPSVFLVFTYLTDDFNTTKGIYTTVPHMYKIRQAFEAMRCYVEAADAFIDVEGTKTVAPQYASPIVIDNLSIKNNDWISLQLTVCKDTNTLTQQPGIAIQHSKSNGYSSLLTADEFLAVYDLIMHMDFASLENQAVIMEIASRSLGKPAMAPTTGFTPYQAPVVNARQFGRQVNRGPATPMYQQPAAPVVHASAPAPVVQETALPLPPRPAAAPATPKINMDTLRDIPVEEEIGIDDSEAVNSIFDED